mmetsp:Transcript_23825/g.44243  ORF Transcript_23825/g.44243 Transcript_23825/m.44243 type:complete len:636 (+) Transcript_23825:356-2263(+)
MIYPTSEVETTKEKDPKKSKRQLSTTRGNHYTLGGKNKKRTTSSKKTLQQEHDELLAETKLMDSINNDLCHCCAYGGAIGCLQRGFSMVPDFESQEFSLQSDLFKILEIVKSCREEVDTKRHSNELFNYFVTNLFRQCIVDIKRIPDGTYSFAMDYKIYGQHVCRKTFGFVYGISQHHLKKISERLKSTVKDGKIQSNTVFQKNHRPFRDSDLPNFNYVGAENVFKENLNTTSVDPAMIRAALMQKGDAHQFCVLWLERYFKHYGDFAPNKDEVKLAISRKKEIYDMYIADMADRETINQQQFYAVWNALFPRCVSRPWCDVPGKCDTCYEIDRQRRASSDPEVQDRLREAHMMHRGGLFMLERNEYKRRCDTALRNKNTIMSGIIDGMDQGHCRCPYKGTQNSFSHPLSQSLTGFLEHGHGLTIYRTVETVTKGANLTLYCILAQLESWKNRHGGNYPEEFYLQIDGGSENANQYLLAMMELLIVKRICRVIYVTRLPTGHTHEDIDACFGLIWTAFRHRPCESLQRYKQFIEDALGDSALKANVVDVMVVPDYKTYFSGCIDENLGQLHTNMNTQHQWRFEAMKCNKFFPYGAKTTYKAYSSNEVIEFEKLPKASCISRIGQVTGLECKKSHM